MQTWAKSKFFPAIRSKTKLSFDVAISLMEQHYWMIYFAFRSIDRNHATLSVLSEIAKWYVHEFYRIHAILLTMGQNEPSTRKFICLAWTFTLTDKNASLKKWYCSMLQAYFWTKSDLNFAGLWATLGKAWAKSRNLISPHKMSLNFRSVLFRFSFRKISPMPAIRWHCCCFQLLK